MTVFDVLCLAYSNKMGGSCIAGLRLDGGGWIRPVAATKHGELYPAHYILQDGSCPRNFDILRIPFAGPQPSAHQPENWLIADEPWQLISRNGPAAFAPLIKKHLMNGAILLGSFSHRISSQRFETAPAVSSLCLIRPEGLRLKIENRSYNSHKVRAQFRLKGTSYLLSVTDPAWLPSFRSLSPGEYSAVACGIPPEPDLLFTVSLGDPWEDGCCYKLVAAILPVRFDAISRASNLASLSQSGDGIEQPIDSAEAARIIGALADGIDPYSNRSLSNGNPLSHPDTRKALRAAEAALLCSSAPVQQGKLPPQPRAHGRTMRSIRAGLTRLGLIE
jgi:hypothetical protein